MIILEKENIKPYLSILMAINKDVKIPCDVHKKVLKIIVEESSNTLTVFESKTEAIAGFAEVTFTPYKIEKKPSWLTKHEALDIEHHVFVSINVNNYLGLYFSEKGKKDEIRGYFGVKELLNITPVPISDLNSNFINEDKIKMLWLTGIHGKNNFKADSKVLGGDSVADTLDPLIDQSYMMSAVRTESFNNSKTTIGINPFKSSIWRGPCKDWKTFENRVIQILDLLSRNNLQVDDPISILSYPISNCNDIEEPYDFSLIDYEFFPEEDGQHRKELLRKIQYDFSAELQATFIKSDICLDIFHKSSKVGNVIVEIILDDYQVSFKIKKATPVPKNKQFFNEYIKVFKYPDIIKCWFESGHAIINGMTFKTGYQDVQYDKFIWADFENYNLKKEKPGSVPTLPELDKIGKEKSLFCWVKNRWSGDWIDPDDFNTTEKPKGWLYCDDGAGEKADFIHLTEYKGENLISLIHVKAAKSSSAQRRISVGAHDVVLNQGVKNLRYCMRKNLTQDLQDRLDNAKSKECWFNGEKAKAEDFILALNNIQGASKSKVRVIIVQPHTQKGVYENTASSNSKRQLDVLLISAENAVRSSGSEFHIIGFHDKT